MRYLLIPVLLIGLLLTSVTHAAAPDVSNVRASQREGTKLVDIYYDLSKPDGGSCYVRVEISTDGGVRWTLPATSFTGAVGSEVTPGNNKLITWNAGADFDGNFADNCKTRVTAYDDDYPTPPLGMVYIPAGTFQIGDNLDGYDSSNAPVTFVYVSAFFIDRTEVRDSNYRTIRQWANENGYDLPFLTGLGSDHPVNSVSWYVACKFANAKSEYEGLTPCYYTDSGHTTVYRSGSIDMLNEDVDWTANGYRLPTEAEWEKAARGGYTGKRFPWGKDTATHDDANYIASLDVDYDLEPAATSSGTNHPQAHSAPPYTMPVASFPPNDYGLHDCSGNALEWCWDRFSSDYYGSDLSDPRGNNSGSIRVLRGGTSVGAAWAMRCAARGGRSDPSDNFNHFGFRLVKNSIE